MTTSTRIHPNDSHRAVVEDHTFRWHVVAKGTRSHCEAYLAEWLETHPLQPLTTAYVLAAVRRIPGPVHPPVVLGQEAP